MKITFVECEKCGSKLTIETDDEAYKIKRVKVFEKKHEKCRTPTTDRKTL